MSLYFNYVTQNQLIIQRVRQRAALASLPATLLGVHFQAVFLKSENDKLSQSPHFVTFVKHFDALLNLT